MQNAVESAIDTLFTSLDTSARTECIFRLLPLVTDNQRDKLRDRIEQLRGMEPESTPAKRQRTGAGDVSSGMHHYDNRTPETRAAANLIAGQPIAQLRSTGRRRLAAAVSEFKEGDWLCIGCHSHNFRKQRVPPMGLPHPPGPGAPFHICTGHGLAQFPRKRRASPAMLPLA
jgi:hypothetical protein